MSSDLLNEYHSYRAKAQSLFSQKKFDTSEYLEAESKAQELWIMIRRSQGFSNAHWMAG